MNRDVHLKVGGDVMITLSEWTCTINSFYVSFPLRLRLRYATFVQS
jgi:hypothetical protein